MRILPPATRSLGSRTTSHGSGVTADGVDRPVGQGLSRGVPADVGEVLEPELADAGREFRGQLYPECFPGALRLWWQGAEEFGELDLAERDQARDAVEECLAESVDVVMMRAVRWSGVPK